MIKNYYKRRLKFIDNYKTELNKPHPILPDNISKDTKKLYFDSWFDVEKIKTNKVSNNVQYKNKFPKEIISCLQVKMILNDKQKLIINKWFDSYIDMYNKTLTYVRNNCPIFKGIITFKRLNEVDINKYGNMYYLRKMLINEKNDIKTKSSIDNNPKLEIHTHTLDYAISSFASNLRSAYTNTIRGNFKHFTMKFMKYNKPSKILEIEKQYIKNNMICPFILGPIKYVYNKKEYTLPEITSNIKINYNSMTDVYRLLIPIKNTPTKIDDKPRNLIVLDPGLRTFMTGLTEKEGLNIGINVISTIKNKLGILSKINNNENIPKKIKKKNERLINRKIHNKVDELHWKTINFLVNNFNNVLIGNMSAKQIVKRSNHILSNDTKTACLRTRYYEFRQRLNYKCTLNKVNYVLVNECYTSKICSNCGCYNDKLKGDKVYNCKKCNLSMDRDINACRNIYMKSFMDK
jgi:IS605 OrfB family transposase